GGGFDVGKGGHYKPKPGKDLKLKWFLCLKEGKNLKPAADKSKDVISDVSEITTDENVIVKQTRNRGSGRCGFRSLKQMCGRFDRVGAIMVECKNQKKKINLFIGDRDAHMGVEKLLSRKLHSLGFYVNYKLGDDDKLGSLFWADEQAIRDYVVFGDIVSFDATFRSNKYKMVFVPFNCINHHNRCITFASGLLSDETIGAYKWLLEEFKNAFGKDPNVVITDQDLSMKIAIPKCFPNTRHCLCLMRTTSRSESENHFFGKWTSPHLTLVEILSHYDTAIEYQRYIERKNDHDSGYNNSKLKTDLQMEKEAINVVHVDNAEKYSIRDMQAENKIRGDNNFVVYQTFYY
nr:hypothetical protein [Tanacetum cinerariifolium]